MFKLNAEQLKTFWQQNRITILVVSSALILTILLLSVRAAGPFVTYEAEGANILGNTIVKSSSEASGGNYVEFAGNITSLVPGRIAVSSDGNFHDRDDIAASAMTMAILAKTGNAGKLVYYGHSDHLWETQASREEQMRISVEDTAKMWGGFDLSNIYNAKQETSAAINALAAEINKSTASDPLWLIGAGPMELICRAIKASNTAGRAHTKVISHSDWNNTHAKTFHNGCHFDDIPGLGVDTIRIIDQNAGTKRPFSEYSWLNNSSDPKLNWLWDRAMVARSDIFDPSDAGITYWLVTGGVNGGDENSNPEKWRDLFTGGGIATPPPVLPPPNNTGAAWVEQNGYVVIEAESRPVAGDYVSSTTISGYSGAGYYVYKGKDNLGGPATTPIVYGMSLTGGEYWLSMHSVREGSGASDEHNDVWIRWDGGKWIKYWQRFGKHKVWTFGHRIQVSSSPEVNADPIFNLSSGTHTLEITGRTSNFAIDKIHLHKGGEAGNPPLNTPESPRQ